MAWGGAEIVRRAAEIDAALAMLPPASAVHMLVLHDHDCQPDACTCSPEYVLEPLTLESFARGAQAEREWSRA